MNWNLIFTAVFSLLLLTAGGSACGQDFKANVWLEDFAQIKREMSASYANLEWAIENRGLDLKQLSAQTESRLLQARNETEAKKIIESFLDAFGDGHLSVVWAQNKINNSSPAENTQPVSPILLCQRLRYQSHNQTSRIAFTLLDNFREIKTEDSKESPCDEECEDRLERNAANLLTAALVRQVEVLKRNKINALLADITGNGGAGCGYTNGGIQTFLKNSRAKIKMPDCVRLRADGTNEVAGITPDVLIPWRLNDSRYQRVKRVSDALSKHVNGKKK